MARQNRVFDTVCHYAEFRLGIWPGGSELWLERAWTSGGESCSVHFTVCLVYFPYMYCCCYCSLHLLFWSTALNPTHEFLLFSFLSPSQPSGERGDRATVWPCCYRPWPKCSIQYGAQMWGGDNSGAEQCALKELCYNLFCIFIVLVK